MIFQVDALLESKEIDLNSQNILDETALILAAKSGAMAVVQSLLEKTKGLDVNVKNSQDETALFLAVRSGRKEVVQGLLKSPDLDVNMHTKGKTAFSLAVEMKNEEIVLELLKTKELHITAEEKDLSLAVQLACAAGNTEIVDAILELGINISNSDRDKIADLVKKVGEKDTKKWDEFLTGSPRKVLSVIVLMAKFITGEKKEELKDFWKYLLENNGIYKYIISDETKSIKDLKVDSDGNSILHYCASHEYGTKILKLILTEINKGKSPGRWAFRAVLKNINQNTFLAVAVKSSMRDDNIIHIIEVFTRTVHMTPRCTHDMLGQPSDGHRNTILHLAVTEKRHDLVRYLLQEHDIASHKNMDGLTAFHMAVKQNNLRIVKIFSDVCSGNVKQLTGENETALHISVKKGNTEVTKLLIELGADYAARDEDGNTPLHDLLQLIHLETDDEDDDKNITDMFLKGWQTAVENCVTWWCKINKKTVPDIDSNLYRELRHDAMYCLRSGYTNKDGLSVLEYAATLGLSGCVAIMLTQENVFVKKPETKDSKKNEEAKFEIEVSNLMPEFQAEIKAVDLNKNEHRNKSFLETLSSVKPAMKVSDELGSFPMAKLAKKQWYIYQSFIIAALLIQMVVMGWYTYESSTSIRQLNGKLPHKDAINMKSSDFFIIVYAAVIGLVMVISIFFFKVHKTKTDLQKPFTKSGLKRVIKNVKKITSGYIEATGALLNILTHLMAFAVENLPIILTVTFIASSVICVPLCRYVDAFSVESYVLVKSMVLLSGWMIVLLLGRAYSPIFNFITILKYIFVKDIVPFLLFYVFLSVAFGCAIQLQFQILSETTAELDEFGSTSTFGYFINSVPYVVWELFIMTVGMDTDLRHIQNVGYLFELDGYRSFYIELLLFIYGLMSTIILLNMLIAAMNTTFSDVTTSQGKGWRQYQVEVAIQLRNLTFGKLDRFVHTKKIRRDGKTNRWYLEIYNKDLKRIRARYWKRTAETRAVSSHENDQVTEASKKDIKVDQATQTSAKDIIVPSAKNVLDEIKLLKEEVAGVVKALKEEKVDLELKNEIETTRL